MRHVFFLLFLLVCGILFLSCPGTTQVSGEDSVSSGMEVYLNGSQVSSGETKVFDPVVRGAVGDPLAVTIKNVSPIPLHFSRERGIRITGSAFSAGRLPASILASGAVMTFPVCFCPSSLGEISADVTIRSMEIAEPFTLVFVGTGLQGTLLARKGSTTIFSGGTYDLGVKDMGGVGGTVSEYLDFVLDNQSEGEITLTGSPTVSVVPPGEFSLVSSPSSGTIISSGGSANFRLLFFATAANEYSAAVSVDNNSPETPLTFTVRGTAGFKSLQVWDQMYNPVASEDTAYLDIGSPFTFHLDNAGAYLPLNITGISLAFGDQEYSITSTLPAFPYDLPAGDTLDVTVELFNGTASDRLLIYSNDPDTPTFTIYLERNM